MKVLNNEENKNVVVNVMDKEQLIYLGVELAVCAGALATTVIVYALLARSLLSFIW